MTCLDQARTETYGQSRCREASTAVPGAQSNMRRYRPLRDRIEVVFTEDEQHLALSTDVEQYLALIYRSEAFVVVVLSREDVPEERSQRLYCALIFRLLSFAT